MEKRKIVRILVAFIVILASTVQIQPALANGVLIEIEAVLVTGESDEVELDAEIIVADDDLMNADEDLVETEESEFVTVSFELAKGDSFEFAMQIVSKGEVVAPLAAEPAREGYNFIGWSDFQDVLFDFSQPIIEDITLYAQWEVVSENVAIVSFELNGGDADEAGSFNDQVVVAGRVSRPVVDPLRYGYEFVGWFTAATRGDSFDFDQLITEDTTVYARWMPLSDVTHNVTFNFSGGVGEMVTAPGVTVEIPHGVSTRITHASRTRDPFAQLGIEINNDEYTLVGWSLTPEDAVNKFDFSTIITENITLYALWANPDAVSFPTFPVLPEIPPLPTMPQQTPTEPPLSTTPSPTAPPITNQPPIPGATAPGTTVIPETSPGGGGPSGGGGPPSGGDVGMMPPGQFPGMQMPPAGENQPQGGAPSITEPPETSGVNMSTNENGDIVIFAPQTDGEEIVIANVPPGTEFLRTGSSDEMLFILPPETNISDVAVTTPTDDWTHEIFHDVDGNLILAILPPDVYLADILSDPLNPQPEDETLLIHPDSEIDQDMPREPDADVTRDEDDDDENLATSTPLPTPPAGLFANSLAIFGALFLKSGQILLNKNKPN